ncbi:MAG TPA: thiamine pyrophosphate-dependent dehydrogenase E1 component subunit alpha [Candidatus Binatia bacterium]|nr:thiamine pyrophosphate-dependent dehydrogenase E1 component subunit alpha [Candidatus Binatia bacterium]
MNARSEFERRLLREMIRIRTIEQTIADLYPEGEMRTPTHFSIGQEAVAVGVCAALRSDDVVYSGHRCHAHYLAKGGDLAGMVAELYGRETGCAHGRGGSVHLNDPDAGFIAASAILGQTMAAAVGSALAFRMDGLDRVAVTFFGDGTVEEGIFHESLNFAVVKRLPVLFACENNGYSTHTRLGVRQPANVSIHARAASYGMPSACVDGNDVFAVSSAAREAVERARRGEGPSFLECITYRWREHVGPLWDYDKGYRTKTEVDEWIARCPIKRATERLVAEGTCSADDVARMERDCQEEVDRAVAAAKAAPFPAVQDLTAGTY